MSSVLWTWVGVGRQTCPHQLCEKCRLSPGLTLLFRPCCTLRLPATSSTLTSLFIRLEISPSYILAACFTSLGGDTAVRLVAFFFSWCLLRHGLIASQRRGYKLRFLQVHEFSVFYFCCCFSVLPVEDRF